MIDDHIISARLRRHRVRFPAAAGSLPRLARSYAQMLHDDVMRGYIHPPRMIVIPGEGAVCPAIVTKGSSILNVWRSRSITPPTSKTMMCGPLASTASRREPGPSAARLVTLIICPPLPPGLPPPSRARRQMRGVMRPVLSKPEPIPSRKPQRPATMLPHPQSCVAAISSLGIPPTHSYRACAALVSDRHHTARPFLETIIGRSRLKMTPVSFRVA